jgi:hypothetical protein
LNYTKNCCRFLNNVIENEKNKYGRKKSTIEVPNSEEERHPMVNLIVPETLKSKSSASTSASTFTSIPSGHFAYMTPISTAHTSVPHTPAGREYDTSSSRASSNSHFSSQASAVLDFVLGQKDSIQLPSQSQESQSQSNWYPPIASSGLIDPTVVNLYSPFPHPTPSRTAMSNWNSHQSGGSTANREKEGRAH